VKDRGLTRSNKVGVDNTGWDMGRGVVPSPFGVFSVYVYV